MRKMSILFLAVVLIIGMSVGVMANTVNVPISVSTSPYAAVYLVTDLFAVNGLFGSGPLSGEPGLYVSDGNATKTYVEDISAGIWGIPANILGDSKMTIDENNVEVFMVDTNTNATVTLAWTENVDWPLTGLHAMFRTSSNATIPNDNHGFDGPVSDLRSYLASIANGIDQEWREDALDAQVHEVGDSDTLTVEAKQCSGPYLYHLNGALFLEKSDSILANDSIGMKLTLTVEAPQVPEV